MRSARGGLLSCLSLLLTVLTLLTACQRGAETPSEASSARTTAPTSTAAPSPDSTPSATTSAPRDDQNDPPRVPVGDWQWDPHIFDLLADGYQASAEKLADAILGYEKSVTLGEDAEIIVDNFAYEFPPAALVDLSVEGGNVEITYLCDEATHLEKIADFEQTVEDILNSLVKSEDSERLRALLLYEYVVSHVRYFTIDFTEKETTAFHALTEGVTICYGFADAFGYLLRQTGIEAHMIRGAAGNGAEHGWTYAEIDGKWYHFDPTWETSNRKTTGQTGLYYFGMNDSRRFQSLVRECVYGFGDLERIGVTDGTPEWLLPYELYPYNDWSYDRESGKLTCKKGEVELGA